MNRCHCCGGTLFWWEHKICSTCYRDERWSKKFAERVKSAEISPQVCLTCGRTNPNHWPKCEKAQEVMVVT